MTRRRLAGTRWRFLAHGAPTGRNGMYGAPLDVSSDDDHPTVFDEVVVDRWLHVEQMDSRLWWMNVGGVTLHVTADRDGRPTWVSVDMPGHYDDPVDGCAYRLNGEDCDAADLVPFWARQRDIPAEPDDTDDPWRET